MYSIGVDTLIPIALLVIIGLVFCFVYSWYINGTIFDIREGKADVEIIDEAIYENLSRVKKRKKIIKTINSFAFYGLLICIAPFFIFAIINKMQGNITTFGDKAILVVGSGSMSKAEKGNEYLFENNLTNQFNTYDMIVIEKVDSDDDLKLYDVVTFMDKNGKLVIHRIIKIDIDKDGNYIYTTRGDANKANDAPSTIANIKGKYTDQRIQYIGAVVLFFQSTLGIVTLVILAICLTVNDRQMKKISYERDERLKLFHMITFTPDKTSGKYQEEIYYMNNVYYFNQKGYIKKQKNKSKEFVPEDEELIKIHKEENMEPEIFRYTIERER